jgi:hypothetical protein
MDTDIIEFYNYIYHIVKIIKLSLNKNLVLLKLFFGGKNKNNECIIIRKQI